ncbi:MAG: adenylyltransferase/cytidyltransferase family protein [Nitrososphaerota archaeon]
MLIEDLESEMRRRVVLTSGAFEIIHPAHIKMLWEAKKLGGKNSKLVVVLARDDTIRARKKREPLLNERARKYIISNLKPVDEAVLGFKKFSFKKIIDKVKPDIVVFGYDQDEIMHEFMKFVEREKLRIKVYKAKKYKIGEVNSTTDIIRKLKTLP